MIADILLPFAGGLGMFIYGMQIMAQGLENAAGSRMKSSLEMLTKNKFMGVLLGVVITAVIQSSSATTVMVVGFVNAGIMNLAQAMGVIMGANVGTTVTGWMVSSVEWARYLNPAMLAPAAILAGVVLMLAAKRSTSREVSKIVIGFGLLFVGITAMSGAVAPLKESEAFCNLFVLLGKSPLLGIAAGAIVTAIIQSSSASVGILQSLAAGLVPFSAAIYIIMGQNIGTCATALISSVGAKKNAKTAALMHLLFNLIGTGVFSLASILYLQLAQPLWAAGNISQTQISLIHTLFNLATTLLLFPFSSQIISLAQKLSRTDRQEQDEGRVLLDERMLGTPAIALDAVRAEVLRMGRIAKDALQLSQQVLFHPEQAAITAIREKESALDRLADGISDYILRLSGLPITDGERQQAAHALQNVSDFERIGDHCENISEFSEQMLSQRLHFSESACHQLDELCRACMESCENALASLEKADPDSIRRTLAAEDRVDALELELRSQHVRRMTEQKCSIQAGILFLDVLTTMERISDHARNIAETVNPARVS